MREIGHWESDLLQFKCIPPILIRVNCVTMKNVCSLLILHVLLENVYLQYPETSSFFQHQNTVAEFSHSHKRELFLEIARPSYSLCFDSPTPKIGKKSIKNRQDFLRRLIWPGIPGSGQMIKSEHF